MNIIYIVQANSWNLNHGTPILASQYSEMAKKKKFQVCLVTPTFEEKLFYKTFNREGIFYHYLPAIHNWKLDGFEKKKKDFSENLRLPFKPDLIHIIDLVHFNSQLVYELSKFNVPLIRHICSFEDFCYFVSPIFNNTNHSLCKVKLNETVCSKCISKNFMKNQKFLKKIKFFFNNKEKKFKNELVSKLKFRNDIVNQQINNNFNHLIFAAKDYAEFFFTHATSNKSYSIIPHGIKKKVNLNKINYENKINFIFTGGNAFNKGWHIVEESFEYLLKKYPNTIKLRVYGDKKKTLKSKINIFKNVEFFENFDHNDLNKILKWADVGLVPSYFDTYNLILREFINNQVIPITSNFFSVSDIITNNQNGIILKENNSENLINSIEKIINNQNFKNELQKNTFNTNIISDEQEYEKIINIYNKYVN